MSRNSFSVDVTPRLDLCLDFINTLVWRGSTKSESLNNFADLLKWCSENGASSKDAFDETAKWASKNEKAAAALYRDAIDLRETLYRILYAMTSHEAPDASDLANLNAMLEQAPARSTLTGNGDSFGWRITAITYSAPSLLAPVLWSGGDLIVAANHIRLRHCSNDKCLWVFIDDSKNGSRRWCSMQACGNRAKAQRHYLRRKTA